MLPNYPIKSIGDLEVVFTTLAKRAHVLGVKLPLHQGSLENWCKYVFRNYGTYKGNPFDILEDHLRNHMTDAIANRGDDPDERFAANHQILAVRVVLNDVIHYRGTWNLLQEK